MDAPHGRPCGASVFSWLPTPHRRCNTGGAADRNRPVYSLAYENDPHCHFTSVCFIGRSLFSVGQEAGHRGSNYAKPTFEVRCRTPAAGDSQSSGSKKTRATAGISHAQCAAALTRFLCEVFHGAEMRWDEALCFNEKNGRLAIWCPLRRHIIC
jgi:hypothetical protein